MSKPQLLLLALALLALLARSAPAETCEDGGSCEDEPEFDEVVAAGSPSEVCDLDEPTCDSRKSKAAWEGEYFPGVGKIKYEGPDSKNPMAFRYYNAEEEILGKPMHEWLRFSLAFWHTMRADGSDPFGSPTKRWPWEDPSLSPLALAHRRMEAFFELLAKLGVRFWCFHDRDIAPEGGSLGESNAFLDEMAGVAERLQNGTDIRPLWGTAQLFKHPRYMNGGATNPNATVFAYAAAQVKKAMEVTHRLGGLNYVFWGGREGYHTLLNTDLKLELDNLARFLRMAARFKADLGFNGTLLLEPKPQEPTKHQYDYDVATTAAFLLRYGLEKEFKLNIECNHATLAGHSCEHEIGMASVFGLLGAIDANTGDPQVGWDTDQFLTDTRTATLLMKVVLQQGGLAPGGINFDAKLRRESTSVEDLFYAHIGGMDALARGLRNAAKILEGGEMDGMLRQRYSSYEDTRLGGDIVGERVEFRHLEAYALSHPDPWDVGLPSGQAELFERWLTHYER